MTDTPEHGDMIMHECQLEASPEKVWRAVTVPEFLEQWIGTPPTTKTTTSDEPTITDETTEIGKPTYQLIDATPCTEVRFAWRDGQTERPISVVTINLDPAPDGGTYFRLTHSANKAPLVAANRNEIVMRAAA